MKIEIYIQGYSWNQIPELERLNLVRESKSNVNPKYIDLTFDALYHLIRRNEISEGTFIVILENFSEDMRDEGYSEGLNEGRQEREQY